MRRNKSFTTTPFYLIATPIGNLKEITPRLIETLNEVDFVACEDTRVAAKLLNHLNIKKHLISLFKHDEIKKSNLVLSLLKEGKKGAYLSDAGYPLISDPGSYLVNLLIENDIYISVINGPSAFLPALVGSGLPTDKFFFYGFLPRKLNLSIEEINNLARRNETLIFYEAPHRIKKTITYLHKILGNRKICLARELTKLNEEYIYGTLEEFLTFDYSTIKGEIVLIVEGNTKDVVEVVQEEHVRSVKLLIEKNYSLNEACKIVALLFNTNKNALYKKLTNPD
jgi:16S rRNA (cytidine1402-2'-O)-methyltransferase